MDVSRRKAMGAGASLAACGALAGFDGPALGAQGEETDFSEVTYTVRPVGRVRNQKGKPVGLEIYKKYWPALHRLETCSHVVVVWWFHKNDTPEKRGILQVHPRGDRKNPLTGVFATHSPVRPNLIALTTCKVLSVKDGIVTIDGIDAFDDTPILDLKSAGTRKPPLGGEGNAPKKTK